MLFSYLSIQCAAPFMLRSGKIRPQRKAVGALSFHSRTVRTTFSSKLKVNIHLPLFLSNCSKEAMGALSFQSRRVQTTLFQNGKGIKTFIEIIQNGRYENFVVIRRRAHAKLRHHHSLST